MKQSNESHRVVRQNDQTVQKSQKHDANLRKNSTLYFQIGLIMCLLTSYAALEMTFATTVENYVTMKVDDFEDVEYVMDEFEIYEEPKKREPVVEKKQSKLITDEIKVDDKETDEAENELDLITEEVAPEKKQVLSEDDSILDFVEPVEVPTNIMAVQKVPIYPGCEKSKNNEERRKCMSNKLSKLISKKFDSDLGAELGLSGKQKIYVSFKINKQGEVEILKTRGPHKKLEREANRVVGKIPVMKPGKNNDKPVEVLYNLPITLSIQD